MLTQATPYTTTVHKHGRYRVIAGDVFIRHGYDYPINTTDRSGVRLDILTPIAEQLDAMLSIYSRVYFTRFDLRLPENTPINTGNTWVSDLFKKLRERLKSKLNRPVGLAEPLLNFAYGWVREKEKAKQVHYHCWIALPHRQVRRLGTPTSGIAGSIVEIWMGLTGGKATLVELPKKRKDIRIITLSKEISRKRLKGLFCGYRIWRKSVESIRPEMGIGSTQHQN